ncbi:nuclear inhibitor of protein phosphatase-1 [Anaeramoeba ignava]|uniref:Nuclear inhibitor of protein phosphatase-1 n=1 Tax=Anaeramoeba ignava TaxID=1746090 RepID=A0A9Q0LES4_ANAIG|nr:nuclear inhibitor of protein phosphatase-1 [Anaeramoeba ignava]
MQTSFKNPSGSKLPTQKPQEISQSLPIYKPPIWGEKLSTKISLDVIKEGILIEKINLENYSCFTFGRVEDADQVLLHPSVSRRHAVIQTSKTGEVFIYDLDSTHGTFVNTSRKFVLNCPSQISPRKEFDSLNPRKHSIELKENSLSKDLEAQNDKNIVNSNSNLNTNTTNNDQANVVEEDYETIARRKIRYLKKYYDEPNENEVDDFFDRTKNNKKDHQDKNLKILSRKKFVVNIESSDSDADEDTLEKYMTNLSGKKDDKEEEEEKEKK